MVDIELASRLKVCGARKGNGDTCMSKRIHANGRCKHHGGMVLSGVNSPRYKHGKYSKVMPSKLLASYEEALNDGALLTLKHEIGIVDARLIELLGAIDKGESGSLWQALKTKTKQYESAANGVDGSLALAEIFSLIKRGNKEYKTWQEIYVVLSQRMKLVESERKRYVEMGQVITADRAAMMMGAVTKVIQENVKDKESLTRIAMAINGIMGKTNNFIKDE